MSILELLDRQLDSSSVHQISRSIGEDPATTQQAINAALPVLLGALANNSRESGGAMALAGALDRDHDGSVLDDLMGYLGKSQQAQSMGGDILGHILGSRRGHAEQAIGRMSGMNSGSAGKLLAMLAPLVLGALGRQKRQGNMGFEDLSGMLGRERKEIETAEPKAGSLFEQLIDRDGDGQISDDLASMGTSMLGSFLRSRR